MVILDVKSSSMANQYLNPDFTSSAPNELDAKSSPLAMLAKTCSQIGSDSPSSLSNPTSRTKSRSSSSSLKLNGSSSVSPRPGSSNGELRISDHIQRIPSTSSSLSTSPSSNAKTSSPTISDIKPKDESSKKSPGLKAGQDKPHGHSAVCQDPFCRDPTCPTFIRSQQLLAAASGTLGIPGSLGRPPIPSAYSALLQRDAMIQAQMMAASLSMAPTLGTGASPYVCNWVSGSDYCGRRFSRSEDLLLHLKTHSNVSLANASDPRSLLTPTSIPLPSTSSAHSPSSRFHPYGRPPALPTIPPALGLPPNYLNPYASLYPSLFPRPTLL